MSNSYLGGRHKKEIVLSKDDLKNGFVVRSQVRTATYYKVGEVRKTKDKKTGWYFGIKIRVIEIEVCKTGAKIIFEKLKN